MGDKDAVETDGRQPAQEEGKSAVAAEMDRSNDSRAAAKEELERVVREFADTLDRMWDLSRWMDREVLTSESDRSLGARMAKEGGLEGEEADAFTELWVEDFERLKRDTQSASGDAGHDDDTTDDTSSPQDDGGMASFDYMLRAAGASAMLKTTRSLLIKPMAGDTFNRALLVFAVGALESVVAQVVRTRLRLHPNALISGQKEYSLAELIQLGDLEKLIEHAIEQRVDDLCFGSLEDWNKWFEDNLSTSLKKLALDWGDTWEAVQRRHVVIHNGGRASRLYLAKVPESSARVGDRLSVSSEYLRRALDLLTVLGLRMGVAGWTRLAKEDADEAATILLHNAFNLLQRQRWLPAAALSAYGQELSDPESYTHLASRVNQWIARRECSPEEDEAVAAEVEAWNVGTRGVIWRMSKAALQGDFDALPDLVRASVAERDIGAQSVAREWPLFERLRSDDRFVGIVEAAQEAESALETVEAAQEAGPALEAS